MRTPRAIVIFLAVCCTVGGGLLLSAGSALAAVPEVLSASTSSVTPFEARLEGVVSPWNESTECHFQYGKTPLLSTKGEYEVSCEQATIEGEEQGVGLTVTGLEPATTYHYRIVLRNTTNGEVKGSEESFSTPILEKPVVEGEGTSGVGSTGARLEATIDPDYQKTKYIFEYATNRALAGAQTVSGGSELEGGGGQTASASTGVLQAGEIYYYRVVSENETSEKEDGPIDGLVQSFTTVPTPVTDAPTASSGTSMTFNGHFTQIPIDTRYSFDYRAGAECVGENSTPTVDGGTGTSTVEESWSVPSAEEPALGWPSAVALKPNTEYTVCFVLSNAYGSQVGPGVHVMTSPAPPAIDSESISSDGATGMTLEAQINPNLQETTYYFEYATSEAAVGTPGATTVPGKVPLAAELAELPASVTIGVAQPNTTYYYRVVAENESTTIEGKPATGEIKSYALPVVTSEEAQNITGTAATLSGEVNPEGAETSYYFAYISETAFQEALKNGAANPASPHYQEDLAKGAASPYAEGEISATASGGSSTEPQTIPPTPISGLQPGQTYHYALVAKSAIGLTIGPDGTLTTLPGTPPIVSTGGASAVSQNAATLSGTVATNSLQTEYGFEIGTEPGNYGPATGIGSIGGAATQTVSLTLSKLQPGRTYYYRVTATNADGTEKGQPGSFTTSGFPTLLTPQTSPPLIATPNIAFPTGSGANTGTTTKTLTNAEKLKKALMVCRKEKSKSKKAKCEKAAHKKYPVAKKKK